MAVSMHFTPNPSAIPLISRSVQMQSALHAIAEDIKDRAYELAPYDEGDYRDGLTTGVAVVNGMGIAQVLATNFKSLWIEFGTEDTPTFAPLRRGAEGAGYRLTGGRT